MYIHLQKKKQPEKHLCLECGLCCSGKLFDTLEYGNDERQVFQDNNRIFERYEIIATDMGRHTRHFKTYSLVGNCENLQEDNKCSVYENRPKICKDFECGVLKSYNSGNMTLTTALNIINEVKELSLTNISRKNLRKIINLKNQKL